MKRILHVLLAIAINLVAFSSIPGVSAQECEATLIPGGGTITFSSDRDGDSEIYTMDGSECNLMKLTDNIYEDIQPSVSPDGTKIVFSSDRDGWNSEIFVMNIDGSNVAQLTFADDSRHRYSPFNYSPKWSPDGTKIAYVYGPYGGPQAVNIMNADGSNQHLLVNSPSDCGWPEWLPNGTQISFGSRACGGCSTDNDIEIINSDGTGRFMLLQTSGRDQGAIFSPDGSRFAFTSNRDNFDSYEIYVANADSTNQVRLTYDPAPDIDPIWSADGSKIIFTSARTGKSQIYMMDVDGSNLLRLTNNNANDGSPVWGGQHIKKPPTVSAGGPYTVEEGGTVEVSATGEDPQGEPLSYTWDFDDDGVYEKSGQTVTFSALQLDGPDLKSITVKATNTSMLNASASAEVTVNNVDPSVGTIAITQNLAAINVIVTGSALISDPGSSDTHTALWKWGDGTTSPGTVKEAEKKVEGSHSYSLPGVYSISLSVTDKDEGVGNALPYQYVVIYDPDGGFVTGGGWIFSPAGAYVYNSLLSGKANFGFVSKYQKGTTVPTGQTEFQFKIADFNFHSSSYDWLVVAGSKAQYKGTGTINGSGNYGFILTAYDGQVNKGTSPDKFRIKIWDKNLNDVLVYDNKIEEAEDINAADIIAGGDIVIHK